MAMHIYTLLQPQGEMKYYDTATACGEASRRAAHYWQILGTWQIIAISGCGIYVQDPNI
jgi:hypothetical protein